ncbi:MAG: prepilin peptidase [Alphaproteobacteria bacterium]|nr:prepilin peptidase [Alphaproteobacteria bacterium]
MIITALILLIFLPFILPLTRAIVKKYPTTLPHLLWHVFDETLWKKRDILVSIILFLVFFSALYFKYNLNLAFDLIAPFTAILFVALLFLSLTDWQKRIIPDFITLPVLLVGLTLPHFSIFTPLSPFESLSGALIGYFLPSLLAFASYKFRPDGIGAGDTKLLAMIGAWVGPLGLSYTLLITTLLFSAYAIYTKKRALPLAPFANIATAITLLGLI